MEVIEIQTLIDVTNTNVRRINQGTQLELDQFRNWSTLLQCIGLRAIIQYNHSPQINKIKIDGMGFGSAYKGIHNVWTFKFSPDVPGTFSDKSGSIGLLIEDLDMVPMILNLTETINTKQSVFSLCDATYKNTVVKAY